MQFCKISQHQHQLLALNLEYDFYHVSEHLQRFADATFNDEKKRKSWFQKARKTLKKANVLNLIKQMNLSFQPLESVVKQQFHREIIF